MFLILCAGVFICGWTYRVVADSVITSVIEAPPLQSPATITTPSDGAIVTSLPLDVSGTCPTNSYVVLVLNGSFDGVAWCGDDNRYTIGTSLFSGLNDLKVQAYNRTDLAGPSSHGVQVRYSPPASQAGNNASQSAGNAVSPPAANTPEATSNQISPSSEPNPILLISDFKFKTFSAQQSFTWPVNLKGGTPPYKVHINWGDGQSSYLYFPTDPAFTIKHVFQSAGYYAVTVRSTDAAGQTTVIQLTALINDANGKSPFISPISPNTTHKPAGHSGLISKRAEHWLIVIWPSYIIVALMAISFWLGERREYEQVLHRSSRRNMRRATAK